VSEWLKEYAWRAYVAVRLPRVRHIIRCGVPSNDGFATSSDVASRRMTGRIPKNMFYYVYILFLKNKKLYTGFTSDLKRRLIEHKSGKVVYTKSKLPVKLIHYEAYYLESDARRREKYLKTTEGKRFLKQQLRDLLNQLERKGV
jgi:putative endonuclease